MSEDIEVKQKKRHIKRAAKAAWRSSVVLVGVSLATVVFVALLFLISLRGREVDLPSWVIDPLRQELSGIQSGVNVDFNKAFLFVSDDWKPKIVLSGVSLNKPNEPSFLQLGRLDTGFSLADALRGKLVATDVNVEGVFLNFIKDLDGRVKVQFGDLGNQETALPNLMDIVGGLDAALQTDSLRKFQSLQILAITLNYQDKRIERSWTIDGARIMANRQEDQLSLRTDLALLSGGSDVATIEANYNSVIGQIGSEIGITLTDIQSKEVATQSAALSWLSVLNAPISAALRLEILPDGNFGPLNGTLQMAQGALEPSEGAKPIPFQSARTYFSFDPKTSSLNFSEIALKSRDVTLKAEGYAQLTYDNAWPRGMVSQLSLSNVVVNPENFERPIEFDRALLDFDLIFDPFQIRIGQVFVEDKERDVALEASGHLSADETGWVVGLDASTEELSLDSVKYFWQAGVIDKVKAWVDTNVHSGVLHNVNFSMRSNHGAKPVTDLSFEFTDASVKVVKFLPPVQQASGFFSLSDNVLATSIKSAKMPAVQGGMVTFRDTDFVIRDVTEKPAQAYVDFNGAGAITAVLDLLNNAPLSVMDRIKQPVSLADGAARFQSRIDFPIKKGAKPEEIVYSATAQLRDVKTTKLVKDRVLTSSLLDLKVDNSFLEITGKGRFDNIAFDGSFTSGIGKSPNRAIPRVLADFTLDSTVIDAFSIPLPAGLFSGATPAQFSLEFPKGAAPKFSAQSHLEGAQLKIDGLGWLKPKSSKGKLVLEGQLGSSFQISRLDIQGAGADLKSKVRFDGNRKFASLDISKFTLGKGINITGAVLPNGGLDIKTGRVDLASFLARQRSGPSRGGLKKVNVALDRLVIAEKQELTNLRGSFAMGKGPDGTFTALVNGKAKVSGRITPNKNGIDLIITSKNAGKVLSALGALKKANGGDLVLTLGATETPGVRDGILHVTNVKIQNAPVLAELFNIISVVGLLEQMSGPGILMSEIDAKFRLTPKQVIVSSSSAVGPSMGLSADGYYNLAKKSFDFQGVISPLYLLNGLGQVFTRKGEGLIGFNFNLKGNTDTPKFSVNPLSILTPAMFREIFRRPAPKLE